MFISRLKPAASTYTPNTMNIYYLISIEYLLFNKYCIINDKTKLKSFKLKNLLLKRCKLGTLISLLL